MQKGDAATMATERGVPAEAMTASEFKCGWLNDTKAQISRSSENIGTNQKLLLLLTCLLQRNGED